jgi:hypothetical protein
LIVQSITILYIHNFSFRIKSDSAVEVISISLDQELTEVFYRDKPTKGKNIFRLSLASLEFAEIDQLGLTEAIRTLDFIRNAMDFNSSLFLCISNHQFRSPPFIA